MPTYVYRREDGSTFETEQRMSEDALTTCPTTGQRVKRVITGGTGVIFKGSGFYQTDYVKKTGEPDSKSKPATKPSESGSEAKSAGKEKSADAKKAEPKSDKKSSD